MPRRAVAVARRALPTNAEAVSSHRVSIAAGFIYNGFIYNCKAVGLQRYNSTTAHRYRSSTAAAAAAEKSSNSSEQPRQQQQRKAATAANSSSSSSSSSNSNSSNQVPGPRPRIYAAKAVTHKQPAQPRQQSRIYQSIAIRADFKHSNNDVFASFFYWNSIQPIPADFKHSNIKNHPTQHTSSARSRTKPSRIGVSTHNITSLTRTLLGVPSPHTQNSRWRPA